MNIAIGADHGGFGLKKSLIAHLRGQGHEVLDFGTSSSEAVDYPVFARKVADAVATGKARLGVMIDGAGIGSAMVANKVPGIRAALAYDLSSARNSRAHNDANLLTLGAGLIGPNLATQIVDAFLTTECSEPRHLRRVAMIGEIEPRGAGAVAPSPAGTGTGTDLHEADLQRIVGRLGALLGDRMPTAAAGAPCVATAPDAARRFLDLGAGRFSHGPGAEFDAGPGVCTTGHPCGPIPDDLACYIDHTILKPGATREDVLAICAEAREYRFRSVCVNPCWAKTVHEALRGSGVLTCCVTGFPLGASTPEIKAMEARRAIREGAREIDMVINVGALKSGDDDTVLRDIRAVVEACRDGSAVCKVIIETCLLDDDEKVRACRLAKQARAHFVKTSTGFAGGGATAADITLMASVVSGAGMEVKASGGIKNYDDARRMIEAGASRIGASASVAIIQDAAQASLSA